MDYNNSEEMDIIIDALQTATDNLNDKNYQNALELFSGVYDYLFNTNESFDFLPGTEDQIDIDSLDNLELKCDLLYKIGLCNKYLGDTNELLRCMKLVCAIRENNHLLDKLFTLSYKVCLTETYRDLGMYEKGIEEANSCYSLMQELINYPSNNLIYSLNGLANCYDDFGYYNLSLSINKECYNICKRFLGDYDPTTLLVMNNLSSCYSVLGRFKEALTFIEDCYKLCLEHLGKENKTTLSSMNNLANAYKNLGRFEDVLKLTHDCYEIRKKVLGPTHPDTLSSMSNLAGAYSDLHKNEEALALIQECYNIRKETLGFDHPSTLNSLNNLSITYSDLNKFKEAFDTTLECYNIMKDVYGPEHPTTLTILNNLSIRYSELGQTEMALSIILQCYELRKKISTSEHPETLKVMNNLANFYDDLKRYNEEYEVLRDYFKNCNLFISSSSLLNQKTLNNYLNIFKINYYRFKRLSFILDQYDILSLMKNKTIQYDIELAQNSKHIEFLQQREVYSVENIQSRLNENEIILDLYDIDENQVGLISIDQLSSEAKPILLEDLSKITNHYSKIYICPDGKLTNISFDQYVGDKYVVYLSSAQSLLHNNIDLPSNKSVLFTNADYNRSDYDINKSFENVSTLIGTYIQETILPTLISNLSVYSQLDFNKTNLLHVDHPFILHISTHGAQIEGPNLMEKALIYMSGFNSVSNKESVTVTAKELLQFVNLVGTELVYMDACKTGVGDSLNGEGMYGFRRAIELSGAKYIITTLEIVNDIHATIFSITFYKNLNKYHDIEEAFYHTKKYLRTTAALIELEYYFNEVSKLKSNSLRSYKQYVHDLLIESKQTGRILRNYEKIEDWNMFILQKA